jgi:hypothetical protein
MLRYLIYLFTLSLQASAAFLLIGNTNTKLEHVVGEAYRNAIIPQVENNVIKNIEPIKRAMKQAYINKIAFVMLFTGYIASVFGKGEEGNEYISFFIVLVLATAETVVVIIFTNLMIDKKDFSNINICDVVFPKGMPIIDSSVYEKEKND